MSGYVWMCLNKQDSEYASDPKYAKILNMAKFCIWQGSQYMSVTQWLHAIYCMIHTQNCLLSKIQTYPGIFTSYSDIFSYIVAYLEPYVTLAYLEHCHIQNPDIFRTQDLYQTLSRHILAYSKSNYSF